MSPVASSAKSYLVETLRALRADVPIYAVICLYLFGGLGYVLGHRGMLFGDFNVYAGGCLVAACLVLPYATLMTGVIRITHRLTRRRRLAYRYMFAPRRVARFLAGTVLLLLLLVLFEEMFTAVKSVASADGFAYDAVIANVDKFLHFGRAPVKYMLAFAQYSWLVRIVEVNYDAVWMTIWLGMLYWVVISPRANGMRVRYCLTFCLVWIVVGNLVAGLLPTAGPALYGLATGDMHRFAGLEAFLDGSGSATAATQHYLWRLHEDGASGLGSGISAFPSMHVAIVSMNALFLAERRGWLRLFGILYTGLIMASSVYLGWHYAVDGYAAVLLTTGIYWAVRRSMPAISHATEWRPFAARQAQETSAALSGAEPG